MSAELKVFKAEVRNTHQ